jgi:hypothetical protein
LIILAAALIIALIVAFFVLTDDTAAPEQPIGAPSAHLMQQLTQSRVESNL